MKVRKLSIKNFRGIKSCEWLIDQAFVCLVGPGDSTKTSLISALGLVLSSRYNLAFSDADFYDCDTKSPIVIEAVVVDLPSTVISERSHGKNRSGIHPDGRLEHDPIEEGGVVECLVVRLTVDGSLEPVWEVVRPGDAEGDRITAAERGQLGFFRLGDFVDSHLRWGRGSALTALTTSQTDAAHAVVEAHRGARAAVANIKTSPLHDASALAHKQVRKLGSGPFADFRPGLDPGLGSSASALVLHDGNIPLTQFGLGTRRLTSLAIQENALAGQSIVAIDEVESGLDPHRLHHLVGYLKNRAERGDLQVIFTTHSPIVVETLSTAQLAVVRTADGTTTVTTVPPDLGEVEADTLQGFTRGRPSALLGRRIVVGEGPTEVGFVRGLLRTWDPERTDVKQLTSVTAGVVVTDGAGDTQAPPRSKALGGLGFPTLLLIDGDVTTNSGLIADARAAGVTIIQWSVGNALEDVVVRALPTVAALQELVDLAIDEHSAEAIQGRMAAHLGVPRLTTSDVATWISEFNEAAVRAAIAKSAKAAKVGGGSKDNSKAWFKREDRGEQLGALVMRYRSTIGDGEFSTAMRDLKAFIYLDATLSLEEDESGPTES